ncbi:GPI mannosyltransferase 3 isoform X1 [Drosophila subpulchrella]|uniref:GPI mannosyltransferase 3 isoform X1 n=1 Tax=Drosophila subpulchrella TaxID=1486046 RepID=UPI0018A1898C|nr:GPI mannosyltransferase 3 isoform X1 [Drosophila subpulchrella]
MRLLYAFLLILAVRLASVFVVQTYYVPDEYWQSLEVAHKLTFGYGYLTWEWVQGIRSYVYPLLIAGLYKILALLQLDSAQLLVVLPRVLQALLSAYSDYRFFVWTGKRKWALFLILVPWFWFYTGSRTLANTLEASLTTIALSYFPWYTESTGYLWPAAICCFLRPTAAVIWLPLSLYHLRKSRQNVLELILKRFVLIGLLVAGLGIAIDTYWHGQLIVTPYEFLKYNIFNNIGSFYGSHPWHWYFTVGLPTVLGINTLPFIFGIIETVRKSNKYPVSKQLLITIFLTLVVLSAVEHKEFRFVSSLLPLCLYVITDVLSRWSYRASSTMLWTTALVILVGNVLPAWYLSTVHQKGPIELMPKLREIAQEYRDEREHQANILFLMPCHSTPYYSHIHQNVTMRFLTCEPNLEKKEQYKDEADRFFEDPVHWINSHIPVHPLTALPSHVVLFDPLAENISVFLRNYRLLHRIEHAEVKRLEGSQALVDEWSQALGAQSPNLASLLQHRQSRTGRSILVYQRLKKGEENAFNRGADEEQQEQDVHDHPPLEDLPLANENLFN